MQPAFSTSLSADGFKRLVHLMARRPEADMFLSGAGFDDEKSCFIGVEPCDELVVTGHSAKDDLARFIGGSAGPTLGFLSYHYGLELRGITSAKQTSFPCGHLKKYNLLIKHDRETGQTHVYDRLKRPRSFYERLLDANEPGGVPSSAGAIGSGVVTSSLSRDDYIEGVRKTQQYIRDGYTYQLNLSIKFAVEIGDFDGPSVLMRLWEEHPAPFYAWYHCGPYVILSTSPERFLKVHDGHVISQPIKGTLRFDSWTSSLLQRLIDSPKEDSELSMIVDLIRNDISYNCEYGSVHVRGHKSTFVVDNLIQMYTNVEGTLRHDRTCLDLLLDAFPGGSVTGCPKRKSMELIDELEPHSRDIYCGGFFVIWDDKNMDSSITIRTGYYDRGNRTFQFFAGSGIVIGSDPAGEYRETMAKAEKFLNLLQGGG